MEDREGEFIQRIIVVLNSESGVTAGALNDGVVKEIVGAFQERGIVPEVQIADGKSLTGILKSALALRPDVLAVGGGDGTIGTAAGVLSGSGVPLGVLPFGTFNHMAKDLKVPLDLQEAIAAISRGMVREVDVGEVNGESFINSSTIGAYGEFVRARNRFYVRKGLTRWLAILYGLTSSIQGIPMLDVRLKAGDATIRRTTPFLMVGNNEFDKGLFISVGGRSAMDRGMLSVYVSRCDERPCLAKFVMRILAGSREQYDQVDSFLAEELTIETSENPLLVTTDGELKWLRPPVRYSIRPRALRVIVPGSDEHDPASLQEK